MNRSELSAAKRMFKEGQSQLRNFAIQPINTPSSLNPSEATELVKQEAAQGGLRVATHMRRDVVSYFNPNFPFIVHVGGAQTDNPTHYVAKTQDAYVNHWNLLYREKLKNPAGMPTTSVDSKERVSFAKAGITLEKPWHILDKGAQKIKSVLDVATEVLTDTRFQNPGDESYLESSRSTQFDATELLKVLQISERKSIPRRLAKKAFTNYLFGANALQKTLQNGNITQADIDEALAVRIRLHDGIEAISIIELDLKQERDPTQDQTLIDFKFFKDHVESLSDEEVPDKDAAEQLYRRIRGVAAKTSGSLAVMLRKDAETAYELVTNSFAVGQRIGYKSLIETDNFAAEL